MFKCQFPNCSYTTTKRSQIANHHIIPVSKGGKNGQRNRIWLCPNHHTQIYIPGETDGIHSLRHDNSIIILGWVNSTGGILLR